MHLLLAALLATHPALYATPGSLAPGDTLSLHIDHAGVATRITVERAPSGSPFLDVLDIPCTADVTPDSSFALGCGWDTDLQVVIPTGWPSGLYRVEVVTPVHDDPGYATFTLREATPGAEAGILVLYSDTTDQAYNNWGGRSLYDTGSPDGIRSPRVSWERPFALHEGLGQQGESRVAGFLEWLDDFHLDAAFATFTDVHRDPSLLDAYPILVTFGHDEYWSLTMRTAIEGRLAAGGHALFLSGNQCWWRVEFENAAATRMLCTKVPGDTTSRWNEAPTLWPTNSMSGSNSAFPSAPGAFLVGYQATWTVIEPEHPIVQGLPATFVTNQFVDDEVEGLELDATDTLPSAADLAWGTPADIHVLARAVARAYGVSGLYGWATMTAFTTPGGGQVFKMGYRNLGSEIRSNPYLSAVVLRALAWIRPGTGVGDTPPPDAWVPRNPRPAGPLRVPEPVVVYDVAGRRVGRSDDAGTVRLDRAGIWFLRFESGDRPPRRILVLP